MSEATLEAPVATQTSGSALIEASRRLLPLLRDQSAAIEDARRLTPAAHSAFIDAGLYRVTMPPAFSRSAGSLTECMRVLEILAEGDASAAWSAWASMGVPAMSAFMDEAGAAEMFSPTDACMSGSVAGMGRAIPVEGGYRVSGKWSFVSGIRQATRTGGICLVFENGSEAPRTGPVGQPLPVVPLFPVAEATVIDNWDTTGLRGTGSHDIAVDDLFVPDRFVVDFARAPREGLAPVHYIHIDTVANVTVAAIALGAAAHALESFSELAQSRALEGGGTLAQSPEAKVTMARARIRLAEARGYLYETAETMWDEVLEGAYQPDRWLGSTALASVAAVDAAIEATLSLYRAAGTSAVRNGVLDRCLRDLLTIGAHKTVQHNNLLKYGG